jgi:hypothetical protein
VENSCISTTISGQGITDDNEVAGVNTGHSFEKKDRIVNRIILQWDDTTIDEFAASTMKWNKTETRIRDRAKHFHCTQVDDVLKTRLTRE